MAPASALIGEFQIGQGKQENWVQEFMAIA
jgi:hypothetical protein